MTITFFETILSFDELLSGVEKYKTLKNDYCIIELHTGNVIISTKSETLINRFIINIKFTEIQLTRDDLSFRMADQPLKRSTGNPNLLPLL